ncbi:MAG: hypothetical protein Q9162_000062 [Coniocarpon cinnabarinum]
MAETDTAPAAAPTTLFKKRGPKPSTIRKRPATPPPASSSSSDASDSDDATHLIKRRKITGVQNQPITNSKAPLADFHPSTHAADATTSLSKSEDATKTSHWTTLDASAKSHAKPSTESQSQGGKSIGPQKAPANVRTITVTDFAPDVCKDYKQTGFCGFGDSCKFLHAREDYKQGWQLDKDWETAGNSNKNNAKKGGGTVTASLAAKKAAALGDGELAREEGEKVDELLKDVPFKCVICKEDYKFPVVTQCGHYFCEKCALKRYKRDPSCAICGAGTGGSFSGAKMLKRLLERKKEREAAKGGEAEDGGDGG